MNRLIAATMVGLLAAALSLDADAQRRLGGGRTLGRQSPQVQQRQAAPQQQAAPTQQANPTQQATPAKAPGAAAAAPTSPWKGALLGLAAGLGLATLASYFGLGETFTAVLMAVLLASGLMLLLGFVLRRARGGSVQPAYGEAHGGSSIAYGPEAQPAPVPAPEQRSMSDLATQARPGSAMDEFARAQAGSDDRPWGVPAGFDTEGFLANAKAYFRQLQAAWDRGDLKELEEFTTREMFAALTHERRARVATGATDVLALDATLLGIETSTSEYLASVRFSGALRADGEPEQVDEVWNLSKPVDGRTGWLLAGIQQLS